MGNVILHRGERELLIREVDIIMEEDIHRKYAITPSCIGSDGCRTKYK